MGTGMETLPCGLCGQPTTYLSTRRCHRCWELEGRVQRDPAMAIRILRSLGKLPPADHEHIVTVRPGDMDALRRWLERPNGAHSPSRPDSRVTFEAVEDGGILVRTQPFSALLDGR